MKKDLSEVEPGDVVLVENGGNHGFKRYDVLAKVDRVTRTQIIIGEARYNRSDGTLRGQSIWQATVRVSIPTDEEKARALLKQKRMSVLRSLERLRGNVDSLPEETLDTIIKLGKKPEGV